MDVEQCPPLPPMEGQNLELYISVVTHLSRQNGFTIRINHHIP